MSRALLYLLVVQRKNAAIAFVKGLRSPGRLAAALVWVALLALFLSSSGGGFSSLARKETAQAALPALFSILLLTSSINGLLQRGLTFQEADVDFLFPGPFTRRELVLYRLFSLYPFALVSSALFLLMLRRMCGHAWASYLALVLFSFLLIHLQTILGLVATWIEGGLLKKVRTPLRATAWMLAIVLAFAFVGAATGDPRVATFVDRLFAVDAARVVFYPAAKVGEALIATNFVAALHGLLPLFAAVVVSLVIVLSLQVNFLEASLQTSQQGSLLRARWGRGFLSTERASPTASSARASSTWLYSGAGAIVWKNLVAASRSLRFVLYAVLSIGIYTALVIVRGQHGAPASGRDDLPLDAVVPPRMEVIGLGAMWPLFIQQYVAFDFRRDFDSLAELRQLPLRPFSVAAAELTVPLLLTLAFQALGILGVACFEPLSSATIWMALLAYPPVTLTMLTITNLGFLLFPSRQAASSRGRAGGSTFSLVAIFNMFVTLVSLAPAIVVGALAWAARNAELADRAVPGVLRVAGPDPLEATFAFSVTQWLVAIVLLWLLGRAYARFDVSRDLT